MYNNMYKMYKQCVECVSLNHINIQFSKIKHNTTSLFLVTVAIAAFWCNGKREYGSYRLIVENKDHCF